MLVSNFCYIPYYFKLLLQPCVWLVQHNRHYSHWDHTYWCVRISANKYGIHRWARVLVSLRKKERGGNKNGILQNVLSKVSQLTIQACVGEHADLGNNVIPSAGGLQFCKTFEESFAHFDDASRHRFNAFHPVKKNIKKI